MNKSKRDPTIEIDRKTHHELKILAAIKSVSIKKVLHELVKKEKSKTEVK